MNQISEKNILFDDFSLLKPQVGLNELTRSAKIDSDCIGYGSTSNDDEYDTDKVAKSTVTSH